MCELQIVLIVSITSSARHMNSSNPYIEIIDALHRQQIKSRFLAMSIGFGAGKADAYLSFGEGLLLLIVQSEPDKSIGEIASMLKLERSWVSRMINGLEKQDLLKTVSAVGDKRIRSVRITKKGLGELIQLLSARARVVSETYKALSSEEQKDLKRLLKKLADGLRAPRCTIEDETHPIDAELTRISWMMGVVGENFLGSGMSVSKYQVLHELVHKKDEVFSLTDIAKRLPLNLSSVSRLLCSLEKEKLLERKSSQDDARFSLLCLTKKGLAAWEEASRKGAEILAEALRGVPLSETRRLCTLLNKASKDFVGRLSHHPRKSGEVRALNPAEAKEILSNGGTDLPHRLVKSVLNSSPRSRFFGYFQERTLRGLLRIEKGDANEECTELSLCTAEIERNGMIKFIRVSLDAMSRGIV